MARDWSMWAPVRLNERRVEWIECGARRFREPFFEDSVRCLSGAARSTSELSELAEWAATHPGLAPSGFIFHMSRCGSTLIAQMLAAVDANRVLSEAPALDDALCLGDEWLRAAMNALGQASCGERRLFVKWDCWQTHRMESIRRTFPGTPAIFLYRDPSEVLVSQMRNPGMWTVRDTPGTSGREAHVAQLLADICRAALAQDAVLVNYSELPGMVYDGLFGVRWTEEEIAQMTTASALDAKSPCFGFTSDGEEKRRAATARVREAAEIVQPVYEELERKRRRMRPTQTTPASPE
jgi:hypothetical protein